MAHPSGGNSQHHCKDCNVFFDSSKSLDVHLQYHQENPLSKWGQPGASSSHGEDNNNFIKPGAKRGDFAAVTAAADSSDMQAFQHQGQNFQPFSPQFNFNNRNRSPTPNGMTNQGFNGGAQEFNGMRPPSDTVVKQEPGSFNFNNQEQTGEQNGSNNGNAGGGGYVLGVSDDFPVVPGSTGRPPSTPNSAPPPSPQSSQMPIPTSAPSYRFHPYGGHPRMSQQYAGSDRNVVSSSSPVPRPSPTTSPQHCEKCGFVCPSREALRDHQALAHPQHQQSPFEQFPAFRPPVKTEDEESQILDLDSQKVHNVYQAQQEEEERRRQQQMGGQHSVSALLNWVDNNAPSSQASAQMWQRNGMPPVPLPGQIPINGPLPGSGMVGPGGPPPFSPSHHGMQVPQTQYQHRPYLPQDGGVNGGPGLPQQLITSSQAPNPMSPGLETSGKQSSSKAGNAAWKSNEARRPKTYHCSACNKWFTSSGHLKRHYNTTLHKNAVKQSGVPDPATLPVSSHHHPERDPKHSINGVNKRSTPVTLDSSASPAPSSGGGEESSPSDDASHSNGFGRTTPVQGLPQQPPQQSQPPPQPSSQPAMHMAPPPHQLTTTPPNRLAGPSEMTTGGLLSLSQYHELAPGNTALQAQHSPTHPFLGVGLHHSLPPPVISAPHPMHQPPSGLHHFQPIPPTSMGPSPGAHHPHPSSMGGLHTTMTAYPNGLPPHDSITTLSTSQHHHQHLTSTTGSLDSPGCELRGPVLPPMPNFAQYPVYGVDHTLSSYGGYVVSASQNVGGLSPVPIADGLILPPPPPHPSQDGEGSQLTPLQQAEPNSQTNQISIKIENTYSLGEREDAKFRPGTPPDYPTSTDDIMREKERHKQLLEPETKKKKGKRHKVEDSNSVISSSTGGKSPPEGGVTNMSGGLVFNSSMISEGDIHKCLDCDKQFNKACYLTQHNKSFHSGDKPFKCDRCGKRFPSDFQYQEHLRKHAGDKPYKCEICPKQFNHKTDLRRHLCLHTGEKPYACDVCGKGFIRKDHMMKHVDTHRKKQPPSIVAQPIST